MWDRIIQIFAYKVLLEMISLHWDTQVQYNGNDFTNIAAVLL